MKPPSLQRLIAREQRGLRARADCPSTTFVAALAHLLFQCHQSSRISAGIFYTCVSSLNAHQQLHDECIGQEGTTSTLQTSLLRPDQSRTSPLQPASAFQPTRRAHSTMPGQSICDRHRRRAPRLGPPTIGRRSLLRQFSSSGNIRER